MNHNPIGYLPTFDSSLFKKIVETYLEADEVERGLWILNNLPGIYRDQMPKELQKLREEILCAMITPHGYLSSNLDSDTNSIDDAGNILHLYARGILVRLEVERYNKQGITPHVIDVGPGEYFIPLGLKKNGCKFTYRDIAMDPRTGAVAHPQLTEFLRDKPEGNQPVIFAALEIIEHLPSPQDLLIEALRHAGKMPERIHLSTPCYTFDGTEKNWRKLCGLPHLRTYTPKEFMQTVDRLFPGYMLELYHSDILSIRGCRTDVPDSQLSTYDELKKIVQTKKAELGMVR